MTELSLHILDIVKNSTKAGAKEVKIIIDENEDKNIITITIADNGCGMDEEFLKSVTDPFKTTRTTRKVGMGLSLFQSAAYLTGGSFDIQSELGVGTTVTAEFVRDSIDRQPIGDMASTMVTLVSGNPDTEFLYTHIFNNENFEFSTAQVKEILGGVNICEPEILSWINGYIEEGIECIYAGNI